MFRLRINPNRLTDRPYQGEGDTICSFNPSDLNNFVSELIFGNQTCYLVSGYRGAGKTSFINKAKEIVEAKSLERNYDQIKKIRKKIERNKDGTIRSESFDQVFVYTSFAKYNNQTAFLRQIIRSMFLAFSNPICGDKTRLDFLRPSTNDEFRKLNKRTFFDVRQQFEIAKEQLWQDRFSLDVKMSDLTQSLLKTIWPIIPASLVTFFSASNVIPEWLSIAVLFASIAFMLSGLFGFSRSLTFTTKEKDTQFSNELYDDEIAHHFVERTLRDLKEEGFKVVFILDELDKVEDGEISKLINEMKPYLLSGLADFIVVAGQSLTYKYLSSSSTTDDAVISSLFSKTFHVPIKKVPELQEVIFEKIISPDQSITVEEERILSEYVWHKIFVSKRVPRILINQVRQDLIWLDNEAFLLLGENELYRTHEKVVDKIEELIRRDIDPVGYKPVVKDYIIVQLYRFAAIIESQIGHPIRMHNLLAQFENSDLFYHTHYFKTLSPHLTRLAFVLKDILNFEFEILGPIDNNYDAMQSGTQEPKADEKLEIQAEQVLEQTMDSFKQNFYEFIRVVRLIYQAVQGSSALPSESPYQILTTLGSSDFVNLKLPDHPLFKDLMTNTDVLDQAGNLRMAYTLFQESRFDMSSVTYHLLTAYVAGVLKNDLETSLDYNIENPNDNAFEFILSYRLAFDKSVKPDLLINVVYVKNFDFDWSIQEIVTKLDRYNTKSGKGNYYMCIIVTQNSKENYSSEKFRFKSDITNFLKNNDADDELFDRIAICIVSINLIKNILPEVKAVLKDLKNYPVELDHDVLPVYDPTDIQKGRWGGNKESNNRSLFAEIGERRGDTFPIKLSVASIDPDNSPLRGRVKFFLHNSFSPMIRTVKAKDNKATIEIEALEAFTVGATADYGQTKLELDLNALPNAPAGFRYSFSQINSKISILRALYGNEQNKKDVTHIVKAALSKGRLVVGSRTFGFDPERFVENRLEITYRSGDEDKALMVNEDESVEIIGNRFKVSQTPSSVEKQKFILNETQIQEIFSGKWKLHFSNDKNVGHEDVVIGPFGRYEANGNHKFDLREIVIDNRKSNISFCKVNKDKTLHSKETLKINDNDTISGEDDLGYRLIYRRVM